MQPGNSNRYPVMFSQHKYNLPENAQNLPNTDNDHQQRDVLSTGHKYNPQSKTHFEDAAMQPGNSGKYPVMFNQQKAAAKAKEDEDDSGDEGDSEPDQEDNESAPVKTNAPIQKERDNDEVTPVATKHMSKAERDAYYNTDELRSFA